QAVVTRVVSLPDPPLVAPPLDLVVAPGASAPTRPYDSVLWEAPYVDKRGSARFDAWVPGNATLTAKMRIVDAHGARPALAAQLQWSAPLDDTVHGRRSGTDVGGLGAVALGQWRFGRRVDAV